MELQIRAELANQLREPRRKAYADFLVAAETSSDQVDDVVHELEKERLDPARVRDVMARAAGSWNALEKSASVARLEGPEDIAEDVSAVQLVLSETMQRASMWFLAYEVGAPDVEWRPIPAGARAKVATAHQYVTTFRHHAMDAIRADGLETEGDQVRRRNRLAPLPPRAPDTAQEAPLS
ncbi:hypothetical protein OG900_11405 [Streptomyces sp. NBC_00433]